VLRIPTIFEDRQLAGFSRALQLADGVTHAVGLWGSSGALVTARVRASAGRPILLVTAHLEEADDARDDLELFLGEPCEIFPAWEALPGEGAGSGEINAERLRLCAHLHQAAGVGSSRPLTIVAPIQALMQPVPTPQALTANTLRLVPGARKADASSGLQTALSPHALLAWAVEHGFERLPFVESPGDVAQRGDIVDLFIPGESNPHRIQFYDDTVESIRRFDVSTQTSLEGVPALSVTMMPDRAWIDDPSACDLTAYLPEDTMVVLDGPSEIQEMGRTIHARLGHTDRMARVSEILGRCNRFKQVYLSAFATPEVEGEQTFSFDVTSVSRFAGDAGEAIAELCRVAADHAVYVVCDNDGERQRLAQMIAEREPGMEARVHMPIGLLHRGFEWVSARTIVVGHHEIFHRTRQRRRLRRVHAGRPLESWTDLQPGELVVHVVHGIAVYRGLERLSKARSDRKEEFLTLEFAEGARIHVPCSQVDLVQKYIGAGGHRPRLSKIGGKRWTRTKEQVADAVSEMAESLLRLQALRVRATGTAYPPDTEWQREFEASFLYEETEDQLQVAADIRKDLTGRRPMDRLVCGDVGYGKTELAMRAAFKVAEYGRQVAVLVPTTVLAEQHYATFRERMADYPFSVGCLSRFRSPSEQRNILSMAKKGQIDIVIGTHRLLSKDVAFANLGLLVIDEEQRFGVEHKEKLKAMRETVDVLTLSATPIPRTLHMSLVGLRDISSLQTPPVDRRSIATQVRMFDEELIRNAILREMNRDGQVYFVHNFVQSIQSMADTVQRIVPEARVAFGHGQMKDGALEKVMQQFVRREADVLVATTIIESGIDIPTANTIFINRADRFGLADLHQLRGRVGRSHHRAYCYLLLSPERRLTVKAAKRVKTIEEFSELGAGFRIAMRDLEIRGAGNLLGREQSGHIAAVGYELYCQLLERTVRRLRNEPDPTPAKVHLDLDVTAHIPPHYISAERARIEIYRRIVACRSVEDLQRLQRDMEDAFGAFPQQVARLLELAELRVLARAFGIGSISLQPPDVVFTIDNVATAEPAFADAPGTVRMPDDKTIHLRLPPSYLETGTLLAVLRKMLSTNRTNVGLTT